MNIKRNLLKIQLPQQVGIDSIVRLMEIIGQIMGASGDVELDCSQVAFVDPFGMTVLAVTLEKIDPSRNVSMTWLSVNIAGYLDRMDFFKRIRVGGVNIPTRNRSDQRRSLLELTLLHREDKAEEVADRLATAVVGMIIHRAAKPVDFNTPDTEFNQYYDPIRYALSELLENALTHARRAGCTSASVWIASQYYKPNKVHIAVVDDGCGFLATLHNHQELREPTHGEATLAALKARVSCNRGVNPLAESENQGVGLTTTVKISKASRGAVHIVSGDAYYSDSGFDQDVKRSQRLRVLGSVWNGVAISATFDRDLLPQIDIPKLLPEDDFVRTSTEVDVALRFVDC